MKLMLLTSLRGQMASLTKHMIRAATLAVLTLQGTACNLLDNPTIPEGTISPTIYHSKSGGLGLSVYATALFKDGLRGTLLDGGLLTDELNRDGVKWIDPNITPLGFDERYLPEVEDITVFGGYRALHRLRGQAAMARVILERYAGDLSPAVRGRLYALEGYAIVLLADQYCAGVTLSTLDFEGDYTYKPSLTIAETYAEAVPMFDSALAISGDSINIIALAKVGKARALVGAGRIVEAYPIATSVATEDVYQTRLSFWDVTETHLFAARANVSDREGLNGLPFISSRDPRSSSMEVVMRPSITSVTEDRVVAYPKKYEAADSFSFIVASGIEARLIEAEYHYTKGNLSEMLSILNHLRTDGTFLSIDTLPDGSADTIWSAGSGGVSGLGPLELPSDSDAALTLLFSERGYWLFLTGHRLPDLRRLVRLYSRDQSEVFPVGIYHYGASVYGEYQSHISLPIPRAERINPHFQGCTNRDQ